MEHEYLQKPGLFHVAEISIVQFLLACASTGEPSGFSANGESIPMYAITERIDELMYHGCMYMAEGTASDEEQLVQCKIVKSPEGQQRLSFVVDQSLVTKTIGIPDITDPKEVLSPHIESGRIKPQELICQMYQLYMQAFPDDPRLTL